MRNLQTANKSEANTEPILITTSYESVNDPLVELFFKSVRDIQCTNYRSINVKKRRQVIVLHLLVQRV